MKKLLSLSYTVILVIMSIAPPFAARTRHATLHVFEPKTRVVTVTVFDDTKAPVNPATIRKLLSLVTYDYTRHANISFRVVESCPYPYELHFISFLPNPLTHSPALKRKGEIAIIFTNQSDAIGILPTSIAGHTKCEDGYIVIYNTEINFGVCKDGAGNCAARTILNHEIGHLFGLEHLEDTRSFMYKYYDCCLGQWTPETTKLILEHKWKKFGI